MDRAAAGRPALSADPFSHSGQTPRPEQPNYPQRNTNDTRSYRQSTVSINSQNHFSTRVAPAPLTRLFSHVKHRTIAARRLWAHFLTIETIFLSSRSPAQPSEHQAATIPNNHLASRISTHPQTPKTDSILFNLILSAVSWRQHSPHNPHIPKEFS